MSRYRPPLGSHFTDVGIRDESGQGTVEDGVGERDDEDRNAQHHESADRRPVPTDRVPSVVTTTDPALLTGSPPWPWSDGWGQVPQLTMLGNSSGRLALAGWKPLPHH